MAKSKFENQTQYIESIESWFSDAQELAVKLLMLRQWRWHTRKASTRAGDSSKQKRDLIRQLQKELDSRVDETEQQIEFLASKSQSLENRFAEVWPGLKLAYCDLGDFNCEDLPAGRCGWVALQSLTERVMGWGKYLANEQQKRTLNCQEQAEFIERERWLSGVVDSIRARLLLEESKLLTTTPLVLSRTNPEKKTSGGGARRKRRKVGEQTLTSQGLQVVSALCTWHEIEANGKAVSYNRSKPDIGCREMKRVFAIPITTASEQFKELFGSHKIYQQKWKKNPEGMAYQLAMLNGNVFCSGIEPSEQSDDIDTDD